MMWLRTVTVAIQAISLVLIVSASDCELSTLSPSCQLEEHCPLQTCLSLCLNSGNCANLPHDGYLGGVPVVIVTEDDASPSVQLAAKEIQRFTYIRTKRMPVVAHISSGTEDLAQILGKSNGRQEFIVVGIVNSTLANGVKDVLNRQKNEHAHTHWVKTSILGTTRAHYVLGREDISVLYAAYAFAESMGVTFQISRPYTVPSNPIPLGQIPNMNLVASPTFDIRGLQPFHDFASGPDWWTADDYKAIGERISKMKMDFIGLHTYPYGATAATGNNEPTVFVGLKDDVLEDGGIVPEAAYPTSYANTGRAEWGMTAMNSSEFMFGASQMFPSDCYGSTVQEGNCPFPTTPEANAAVFKATGDLLKAGFTFARSIGVKTCVGTETPLSKPPVRNGTIALKLFRSSTRHDSFSTSTSCAECEGLYDLVSVQGYIQGSNCTGCIALNTYYDGVAQDNVLASSQPGPSFGFVRNEGYAFSAPTGNATLPIQMYYSATLKDHFVTVTTADVAYAKANGYTPVGDVIGYAADSGGVTTQDFYEGIFTRIQRTYPIDYYWIWTPEGWEWGKMHENTTVFQDAVQDLTSALAAHDAVNASWEMATCGWVLGPLPDRTIFDKVLSTRYSAITSIDMSVGNTPVDPSYAKVVNHKKWAIPWMEDDPGLTGPQLWVNRTLEHMEAAQSYGCQGLLGIHWRTGVISPQISAMAMKSFNATLTSAQFWNIWASAEFGDNVGPSIGALFSADMDSYSLPRPVAWIGGPGGFAPGQCDQISKYGFVDQLVQMRENVTAGPLELARFDYWANTFQYMKGIVTTECAWYNYNAAVAIVKKETDPAKRQQEARDLALPARIDLINNATSMMTFLLQTVSSRGEMGTVRNVFAHSLVKAINDETADLTQLIGEPLPATAMPQPGYVGATPLLIVPTVRSMLAHDEALNLEVTLLAPGSATGGTVTAYFRAMGSQSPFTPLTLTLSARSVYEGSYPATSSFEYYIEGKVAGATVVFPAGAPTQTQTVVMMPSGI